MTRRTTNFLFISGLLWLVMPAFLHAQSDNQAVLVIQTAPGEVQTSCVSFSESQITGYDLLVRSGIEITLDVDSVGTAVCALGGTGCPANDCFCQCKGADCIYWSYWHQLEGSWGYSQAGAGIYPVTHGAVEGWVWGPGRPNEAQSPPVVNFDDICLSENSATVTPSPVLPTLTPLPTATPAPIINFWLDDEVINAGNCTVAHWQTERVTGVYFDGDGVHGNGSQRLCPTQTQSYQLRVEHGGDETRLDVIVQVIPPLAATETVVLPTATPFPAPAVTATELPIIEPAQVALVLPTQTTETIPPTATDLAAVPSAAPIATVELVAAAILLPPPLPSATAKLIVAPPLPTKTVVAEISKSRPRGIETAPTRYNYGLFFVIVLLLSAGIYRQRR